MVSNVNSCYRVENSRLAAHAQSGNGRNNLHFGSQNQFC